MNTPLYPSAAYVTSKSPKHLQSLALYASATLARALGEIDGAELAVRASTRMLWAEQSAATSSTSGAQALLNLANVYDNRAGGPTFIGDALRESAERIWNLSQAQATQGDPAPTFEALREELSTCTGTILSALETSQPKNDRK